MYAIEEAVTLPECAEARRLRSAYLRKHGWDWDVLAAADMLDRMETYLQQKEQKELQPKPAPENENTAV